MVPNNKPCAESGKPSSRQIARSSWQTVKLAKLASYWQGFFLAGLKQRNNGKLTSNQAGKFASWQIQFLASNKHRKISNFKLAKLATLKGRGKGLSACLSSTLGIPFLPGRRIKNCCSN